MYKLIILLLLIIGLTGCKSIEVQETPYETRADIRYAIEAESSVKPANVENFS